ncbi:general secretion pathway protein K [Sulfitobacter brevis]|uniref:Type II secretion system protein K n=1 Tax=Sulfitobacter brevis TaxID=74348 RepID=A0A1I1ULW9_9RHOB|nr:type II secretion system protein GspK [Sulfitobacter brevis]SFD70638.1 general secretion pathway protein K [Sulfitobacter brevis]
MSRNSPRDAGVILVNVLVALALGAAIIVLMFTSQENLMDRTRRAAAATQAEALALGAEASMVAALRRDMEQAPDIDHYAENWALAAQEEVVLATGRFSITVMDVRGRLDLNALSLGGLAQQLVFARLTTSLGLPDRVATTVTDALVRGGPVRSLSDIAGLDPAERAKLDPYVSLLATRGALNVNTAEQTVLAAVLGSASSARQLIKLRERKGFLTKSDLAEAGVILLGGVGFTSDAFDIISRAEVDGTTVTLNSRLLRQTGLGVREVLVTGRWYGMSIGALPAVVSP